jgi:hypothetical protein
MRAVKYYPPESRRYLQENLQCIYCGNTHAFFIDLRLRHQVIIQDDSSILVEPSKTTEKVFHSIANNINTVIDNENEVINCANCKNPSVDIQERLLDYCWQVGCPGCDVCGSYIDKEDLVETCTECLRENKGKIEEEDCACQCMYYDNGLEAVRRHYEITLEELKRDAGYL